jgi:hypothetical protein
MKLIEARAPQATRQPWTMRNARLAYVLALSLALTGCPLPVSKRVQETDVTGTVIDAATGAPIPNALVVQTIVRGGFWSTPTSYDLGQTLTNAEGRFTIPANPHRVGNVGDPGSKPEIIVFAPGYAEFFSLRDSPSIGQVRLRRESAVKVGDPCFGHYFTERTCARVRDQTNWRP